jgi:antitoxin VapB
LTVITSRTFRSGNSEAVRLPKEVAYGEDIEVTIERNGNVLMIMPKRKRSFAEMLARMAEIGAPEDGVQKRELIEIPERPGI